MFPAYSFRHALAIAALACLSAANACAQTSFYPNNATINTVVHTGGVVGYANQSDLNNRTNGTSPTLNVVTGGGFDKGVDAYNSSIVNVSGGNFTDYLFAHNNSTLNISDTSSIFYLLAADTSNVNISGGNISASVNANNNSNINISGGNIYAINAFGNDVVTITGGTFGAANGTIPVVTNGTTSVTISGGTFGRYANLSFLITGQSSLTLVGNNLGAQQFEPRVPIYYLYGSLQDGTDLTGHFVETDPGATLTLRNLNGVPEPGSMALLVGLAVAGASFARKRRSLH